MVPVTSILACILTLFVSLILPVLALIVYAARNKREGIVSAWLLGAAGFFVTQMLIRMPILSAVSRTAWFARFAQEHLFLYSFSLAFTAGLFELAGRFAVAKILGKRLTYRRSLAAGLGHGGIEAMFVVGLAYINNLVFMFLLNSGSFELVGTMLGAAGQNPAVLETVRQSLLGTPPSLFLLAGVERLLTMAIQAAMSMLVCWGLYSGKPGRGALYCLGLHTLVDTTAGISLLATEAGGNVLSQGVAYGLIYMVLVAVAVLSLVILRNISRRWPGETGNGGVYDAKI